MLEVRQRRADLFAFGTRPRIFAGLAALAGQQVLGCLGAAFGGELALTTHATHVNESHHAFNDATWRMYAAISSRSITSGSAVTQHREHRLGVGSYCHQILQSRVVNGGEVG